jgi:tetratricopeptide (TPR) repeat protein
MPPKYPKLATSVYHKPTGTTTKSSGKKVVKKKGKVKKKIIQTRERRIGVVENFIVVWLDSNISPTNKDYRNSITQLRRIVNSIKTFIDINECVTFLKQIKDEKIFMIVSGHLGEQIAPIVEDFSHLDSIYVFCCNKSKHEKWACKYRKIKEIFTKIETLCEILEHDIRQCDNNLTSISILSKTDNPTHDLNVLDPSFMYSKLLKEILMKIEHDDDQAKTNLVKFCSNQYEDNQKELKFINEFNKTYSSSSAIWWYTRQCFTYTMLNKALRTQDIEIIIKMGFFVRDLHQQIEQLHSKENHQGLLTVYRGQGMMNNEFEKLLKCQGGLLSFNSFLSTSTDRQIALNFARHAQNDPNITPIFFQMEINPLISSTPFASVSKYSYYSDNEKEILFSMHTVFRIGEIKKIKEGIWKVNLQLTDNNDQQLQNLTDHIRNETNGSTGWHRLGSLMIAMGQFDKAEEFYKSAYDMTSDDDWKELAHLHYQLGHIHDEKGDLDNALEHYEEALDIQLDNLASDDPSLSMTYTGIGSVLHSQYNFDEALEHFQHALQLARKNSKPDLLKIAIIHSYIGGVFDEQDEPDKALDSYQEALHIRQKHLPPVHPLLATTYNNIGLVHKSMNDYSKALEFLKKNIGN